MGMFKKILIFLEETSIDTEYYLNDEARELYEKNILNLRKIEQLPVSEYAKFLDLPKLIKEEEI